MTLEELRGLEHPRIDCLEILSLEGQFYMARLHMGEQLNVLSDEKGKTCLMKSAWQIQDALGSFDVLRTEVVHASAYGEMVGLSADAVEPLRIPVQEARK
ncbi:DUF6482 family protein [Marinobacter fonticola]|uniref:DUF6482 family protein n=1 Tax=Marinobacter fonticola TaxID=2603215 RepID=UPI001D0D86EC